MTTIRAIVESGGKFIDRMNQLFFVVLCLTALYFVIKYAVRNAIIEAKFYENEITSYKSNKRK